MLESVSPFMLTGCRLVSASVAQIESKQELAALLQHRMAAVPVFEHEELRRLPLPQPSTRMCQADVTASCVERRTSHAAPHRRLDETRRAVHGLVARMAPTRMHT